MKANEFFKGNRPLVYGHRGFSSGLPENTIESFDSCAQDKGVDGIELDVHLCASGEVVVAHDFTLKRTAAVDKEIQALSWDELRKIDVGSFKDPKFHASRVPLLEEVFSTFGSRFIYDIELKVKAAGGGLELCKATWEIIQRFKLEDRVSISSFNPLALRKFKKVSNSEVPTADIFCESADVPRILWHGFGHVASLSSYQKPDFTQVNKTYMAIHGRRPVVCWTVNDEETVRQKAELGVAGLIGNDPHMIARVLEEKYR